MSARIAAARTPLVGAVTALLLTAGVVGGVLAPATARADSAPPDPGNPATPTTVTADPLPTVQINGVVWSQTVVGNTVYVAGEFTRARPAGAPRGTQETVRNNLLAYDIRTGQLIQSFAPSLNAQALVVTASPDGSRLYVGGSFTSVNGQARYRVAAFDTATGALVANFRPAVNAQVRAIAATNTTVYIGGSFGAVGSSSRNRLAALSASTGALLPWAPQPGAGPTSGNRVPNNPTLNATPSRDVMSLVVAGSNGQVVAAGRFYTLNGVRATGVGALDGVTGATRPFEAGTIIRNHGITSAVYHVSTDGTNVYGVAYDYYGPGNLEGAFAVAANGGTTRWYADCRGDSYSSFPTRDLVYTASHAHTCVNIGSFPDQSPKFYKHGNAFSKAAAGVNTRALDWNGGTLAGRPAPAHQAWAPSFDAGSYTGQYQAAWSVAGNEEFVVYGGEFPFVNDRAQQGLVRFAVPASAPKKVGPTGSSFTPTLAMQPGAVRVSWRAAHDPDNEWLTYRVYRDAVGGTPVCVVTRPSTWWNRATYACSDTGATAGSHRYQVVASDAWGNTYASSWTTATVGSGNSSPARMYAGLVQADGALNHWPLGESSGTTAYDRTGTADMTAGSGVARRQAGAIAGDPDTASSFNGTSSGGMYTRTAVPAPQTFSVETWFQTTSTSGGKLVGFGNAQTGLSSGYDRHIYMDTAGRVYFGVYSGADQEIHGTAAYNDGRWHHVVGTLDRTGLALYIDGKLIGKRAVPAPAKYSGYWRVGGDNSWLANQDWFNGRLDEVAVYPAALTADQVAGHFSAGSSGKAPNVAPTASFTAATSDLAVTLDGSGSTDPDGPVTDWAWDFGDGATGAGAKATHTYRAAGTYQVRLTVTDGEGATGVVTRAVTATAPPVGEGSVATDAFGREVTSGWGSAERGGAWTISGGLSNAAVTGGSGRLTGAPGQGMDAVLGEISRQDVAVQAKVVLSEAPTGGGTYISLGGRQVGSTDYRATARFRPTGEVDLRLDRIVQGAEIILVSQQVLGSYVPGTALMMRFEVSGTGSSTVKAKLWAAGRSEPAWMLTRTDGTAELQRPGALFVETYTSGSATRASTVLVDDVRAEPAGTVVEPEPEPNLAPVARFTDTPSGLAVSFDGTPSTDDDGRIASYSWDFGDGSTGTGATASHTYAAGGTYPVVLTVTDDDGATGQVRRDVTVTSPVNAAPVASFTVAPVEGEALTVTADASASTDPDGRITATAFDFGDGGKGTGVISGHTYAAAGTYTVTLTVTDDDGETATTTRDVTVTEPAPDPDPAALALDAFDREVATGWGTADKGGAWTTSGGSAQASVTGGSGRLTVAPGATGVARLGVSARDVALQADVVLPEAATGGGSYLSLGTRSVNGNRYNVQLSFAADGRVRLNLVRLDGWTETWLAGRTVLTGYVPGTTLTVRAEVSGTGPTTLKARAWAAGTTEPATWQVETTDSTPALQTAGELRVDLYNASSSTGSTTVRLDDLWLGNAGGTPPAP